MVATLIGENGTFAHAAAEEAPPSTAALDVLARVAAAERERTRVLRREPVVGIWDEELAGMWTRYRVTVRFLAMVMGGTPKSPEIIEGWLRSKAGISNEDEVKLAVGKILAREGVVVPESATMEDMVEAVRELGAEMKGNGFLSNDDGLIFESYKVKAMLKEATNILYAGTRWGTTKKGPKAALAEWLFPDEADDEIPLGVVAPDGTHLQVGQVSGPQGRRSTLTYYDFVWQPRLTFGIKILNDPQTGQPRVTYPQLKAILSAGQDQGMGALRSMGYGRFKVVACDRL